jgi:hypothetical protein
MKTDPLCPIHNLLPVELFRAIRSTKPLMPLATSMDRWEIEAGSTALFMSAGPLPKGTVPDPGTTDLAELVMWVRLLKMMPGPVSPLDGPDGRNALCVYLAEKINAVWRTRPEAIERPYSWSMEGSTQLTLAECFAQRAVLPHPAVLDERPRELLRSQLAQPGALYRAAQGGHYFVLEFVAGTPTGHAAVVSAFTNPHFELGQGDVFSGDEMLRLLAAVAVGRLKAGDRHGGAEDRINSGCAAALMRSLADAGVRTSQSQVGWGFNEKPERLCLLTTVASRVIEVALSKGPVLGLPHVLRQSARLVGYEDIGDPAAPLPPALTLDFCGAMAREVLDRAQARWLPVLDPQINTVLAQLVRRHSGTPSFVEQYVELLISGGIAPDDVAIPAGAEIPGTFYGAVDKPLSFLDVFRTALPSSCLDQFEALHREKGMSAVVAAARSAAPPAALHTGEVVSRRRLNV